MNTYSMKHVLMISLLTTTTIFCNAERRIKKSELPGPVRKTAETMSVGATVLEYTQDTENGQVEYEVQLVVDGHTKDISMDPQGNVIEVEEQVGLYTLPPDVLHSLTTKAGSGKITKVESLTKHGNIVAYEAQVMTGKKHSEVQVGPDGEKLDHEE